MKWRRFIIIPLTVFVGATVLFSGGPSAYAANKSPMDVQLDKISKGLELAAETNPITSMVVSGVTNANMAAFWAMAPPGTTIQDEQSFLKLIDFASAAQIPLNVGFIDINKAKNGKYGMETESAAYVSRNKDSLRGRIINPINYMVTYLPVSKVSKDDIAFSNEEGKIKISGVKGFNITLVQMSNPDDPLIMNPIKFNHTSLNNGYIFTISGYGRDISQGQKDLQSFVANLSGNLISKFKVRWLVPGTTNTYEDILADSANNMISMFAINSTYKEKRQHLPTIEFRLHYVTDSNDVIQQIVLTQVGPATVITKTPVVTKALTNADIASAFTNKQWQGKDNLYGTLTTNKGYLADGSFTGTYESKGITYDVIGKPNASKGEVVLTFKYRSLKDVQTYLRNLVDKKGLTSAQIDSLAQQVWDLHKDKAIGIATLKYGQDKTNFSGTVTSWYLTYSKENKVTGIKRKDPSAASLTLIK